MHHGFLWEFDEIYRKQIANKLPVGEPIGGFGNQKPSGGEVAQEMESSIGREYVLVHPPKVDCEEDAIELATRHPEAAQSR